MSQPPSQSAAVSSHAVAFFHPDFDRDVLPAVFSVEGVGFKVDVALLTGHSEVLRGMFIDAKDIGLPGEGTAEYPIVIPWCTADAFANFLGWLSHVSWEQSHETEIPRLLDIMHISHMFEIVSGVDHARKELERLNIRPTHRLFLAKRYGIKKWVADAVRSLLMSSFGSLDSTDRGYLSSDALFILTSIKEEINQARHRLAIFPPKPPVDSAPHCDSHDACQEAFEARWLYIVTRRVLSTFDPIALNSIPSLISNTDITGMADTCKEYVVEWLNSSNRLDVEENLISKAVEQMELLCIK